MRGRSAGLGGFLGVNGSLGDEWGGGAVFWVGRTLGLESGVPRGDVDGRPLLGVSLGAKKSEREGYKKWRKQICHLRRRGSVDYK